MLFFGDWRKVKGLPILMEAFDGLAAERPRRAADDRRHAGAEDVDPDAIRSLGAPATANACEVIDQLRADRGRARRCSASARVVATPYLVGYQSGVVHLAMTMARAVVASDVGDLPNAVADGDTGLIVPPGDPEALADALATLLSDPELALRMGAAGRRAGARPLGLGKVAELVERALADGGGPARPPSQVDLPAASPSTLG